MDKILLRKSVRSSGRLWIAQPNRLEPQTQIVDARLLNGSDVKEAGAIGASNENSPLGALEPL
jgi:hypothetical protein